MLAGLQTHCTAFEGARRIATGDLAEVASKSKAAVDKGRQVLIFDDASSEPIEVDFRGTVEDVLHRLAERDRKESAAVATEMPRGPGRPKLGVVAREVTLLPRHWQWLAQQPGGASVALRRLVDEARRANKDKDRVRRAQEAAYRFMAAMAENKPHYEEVARALFAGDAERFEVWTASWPPGVRDHARRFAAAAFEPAGAHQNVAG
jgi:uncharacterized protein